MLVHGSTLIYGGSKKQRLAKCLELVNVTLKATPKLVDVASLKTLSDIRLVELSEGKKSIGIETAKEGANFLKDKPFAHTSKILIINDADRLTTEAQNSLLKTLEEPPSYALIILMAKTVGSLLETVVSRCKKFSVSSATATEEVERGIPTLSDLLTKSIGEKLGIAEQLSKEDKETLVQLLEYWLTEAHTLIYKYPTRNFATGVEKLLAIKDDLEHTNVNTRLALETFLVDLHI